jgi:hypothetical protein
VLLLLLLELSVLLLSLYLRDILQVVVDQVLLCLQCNFHGLQKIQAATSQVGKIFLKA